MTAIKKQIKLDEEARDELLTLRKMYWEAKDMKNYKRIQKELRDTNIEIKNLKAI